MKNVKYLIAVAVIALFSIPALTGDVFAGRVVRTRSYSTSSVSVRAPAVVRYSESCDAAAFSDSRDASRAFAESCDVSQTFETRTRSRTRRVKSRAPRSFAVYEACDNN